MLPTPSAPEEELLWFGGSFDGYVVTVYSGNLQPLTYRTLEEHESGRLPVYGLTMARAALFGFTRWHHHTSVGGSMAPEWVRCMRALLERIRELVYARDARRSPQADKPAAVEDRVMDAYERLLEGYARWGGYRAHGWTDFPDERNYHGPLVWSEQDCALRFALELEREWPQCVHMEFPIGKATRADYDPDVERRQRVDVAVSDQREFVEDKDSQERFRVMPHEAFFEVKWFTKGWRGGRFERDAVRRVDSVLADVKKLARHVELGRCAVGAVLTVDDEEYFAEHADRDDWPPGIWWLQLSPAVLERRGLLHAPVESPKGA
jgi:hypothetical protein